MTAECNQDTQCIMASNLSMITIISTSREPTVELAALLKMPPELWLHTALTAVVQDLAHQGQVLDL